MTRSESVLFLHFSFTGNSLGIQTDTKGNREKKNKQDNVHVKNKG